MTLVATVHIYSCGIVQSSDNQLEPASPKEPHGLSGTTGQGRAGGMERGAAITEPAALREALRTSYAKANQALFALAPADLHSSVTLFGRRPPNKEPCSWCCSISTNILASRSPMHGPMALFRHGASSQVKDRVTHPSATSRASVAAPESVRLAPATA
jgi:hypothetical protein